MPDIETITNNYRKIKALPEYGESAIDRDLTAILDDIHILEKKLIRAKHKAQESYDAVYRKAAMWSDEELRYVGL